MKKIFAAALAVLLLAALAGCGGDPKPTNPGGNDGNFYFEAKGVRLAMGAEPAAALAALGEALHSFDCPSCAIDAVDTTYAYPGFELTITDPDRGENYITSVILKDDTYTTPEGVCIGSTLDEVLAAYGTDYKEETGFYTYTRGRSTLQFEIASGAVGQIQYDYLF